MSNTIVPQSENLKGKPLNNKLLIHIQNSPLVQAAITEAVHRFYYERALSTKERDQQDLIDSDAANVLSTLWNLMPNWRYFIKNWMLKYRESNTTSVNIDNRPVKSAALNVTIEIK